MQGDDDGKIEFAGGKLHNPFRVIKVTNPPGLAYQWNFTPEGGGRQPRNCIPLLGRQRETPTLSGTNCPRPYPQQNKIWSEIHTLPGTNLQKKVPKSGLLVQSLVSSAEHPANLVQFFTFCILPGTKTGQTIPSLAHIQCSKPYPYWQIA